MKRVRSRRGDREPTRLAATFRTFRKLWNLASFNRANSFSFFLFSFFAYANWANEACTGCTLGAFLFKTPRCRSDAKRLRD